MDTNQDGKVGKLAQELLTLAEDRGAEFDLHWGQVLMAFGIAAKAMARAYSPTLVNSNATQQNVMCKAMLDKGFEHTVIMADFKGNEAYRKKWIDAAKRSSDI